MRVLHICGDYPFQRLYNQLLKALAQERGDSHTMYVPLMAGRPWEEDTDLDDENIRLEYSVDFTSLERLRYHHKCRNIAAAIEGRLDVRSYDVVHAHYTFAAGGVARLFKKKYGIPYVTTVRNSDLKIYLRRLIHLRPYGRTLLEDASRVTFVSPAYRDYLGEGYLSKAQHARMVDKSAVIPNGLHEFWFEDRPAAPRERPSADGEGSPRLKLLYVGEFTHNKNLGGVIAAAERLQAGGRDAGVVLVGGGAIEDEVRTMASEAKVPVEVVPWTKSRAELRERYRAADVFVMPSFTETFGLVYLESVSQGTPIIWSRGQGIDGLFEEGSVGFGCPARSTGEIVDRIGEIADRLSEFSGRCLDEKTLERFRWANVAEEYRRVYRSAL